MNSDHLHSFKPQLILMILLLITGCIHNYEPDIKSITADPNPDAPGGIVN